MSWKHNNIIKIVIDEYIQLLAIHIFKKQLEMIKYYIFAMPKPKKTNNSTPPRTIKNIYIEKINSLLKIVGVENTSFPCLNKSRRTVCFDSADNIALQRRENNKGAAKKARERKRIYMELLEQVVQKLHRVNKESKKLEKTSSKLVQELNHEMEVKIDDQIGQYLLEGESEGMGKQISLATMDLQKQCKLNKIVCEIQQTILPAYHNNIPIQPYNMNMEVENKVIKMKQINQQVPQQRCLQYRILSELKSTCSDHACLYINMNMNRNMNSVKQKKEQQMSDAYMGKTLMQEYYSKTMCRKNVDNVWVHKYLHSLVLIDKHCRSVQDNLQ